MTISRLHIAKVVLMLLVSSTSAAGAGRAYGKNFIKKIGASEQQAAALADIKTARQAE